MKGIRDFLVLVAVFAAFSSSPGAYGSIVASVHNEEVQRRSSGTPEYSVGQAQPTSGFRVGYQSSFLPTVAKQGGINAVYYFQLPPLPAGQQVSTATFSVSALKPSTATSPQFNVDLYGVGYEAGDPFAVDNPSTGYGSGGVASTSVAQALFYSGANQTGATGLGALPITRLADNLFVPADIGSATANGNVAKTTSAAAGSPLASYIQSIYNIPAFAAGGGYLALRLNPDQVPDDAVTGTLRYQFPYAPNTDPGVGTGPTYDPATFGAVTLPQIDIAFTPIPEPGGLVVVGALMMGFLRRGRGK